MYFSDGMSSDHSLPPLDALLAHRAWVRFLARRLANDAVDADDLEQDAWLAAAAALPHDGAGIRAWFARVVRNRAAERRRLDVHRRAREAVVARDDVVGSGADLVADAEALARVVQAVLALGEPYRETVLLRFYEGLPPREVAARMDVPVDTVRTRLRRAAELLRAALGGRREDWLGVLAPLLHLRRGAPVPTAAAVAGGIAMKLSTKIAVAALALLAVGGLATRYALRDDAVPATHATAPSTTARPDTTVGRPRSARTTGFDIGGTTAIASTPAPARVVAQRIGAARDQTEWPGVRVKTLATPPAGADSEADADAAGAFLLPGLSPGAFRVRATFADGRSAVAIVDVTAEKPHPRIALAAPEGGLSFRGRALHADGTPFTGWIRLDQTLIEEALWTRTDAGGGFVFAGLAPVWTHLLATDETAAWAATASVQLPYAGAYDFVVDQTNRAHRGRVVAATDGAPVPGATVRVRGGSFDKVMFEATFASKDDGAFEGRWSGRATLFTSAKGFAATVTQDDGKTDEVVVRLTRAAAVVGRVVKRDGGAPVEGAVVRAHVVADKSSIDCATTRTGPDGAFRLDNVPPGAIDVFVLGGGWASPDLATARRGAFDPFVVQVESGATANVDLRAEPSAAAKGRVLDAAGAPAQMAGVSALPAKYFDGVAWRSTSTLTDSDGEFVLPDLLPGIDTTFNAWQGSGECYKSTAPVLTEGGKTVEVEIRLDPAWRLAVTVLEEGTDAPLAGAVVAISRKAGSPNGSWATDAAGRVEISSVPGGPIGVRARAKAHAPSPQDVAVEEVDATHLRATVRLAPGKVVAGRVTIAESVAPESVFLSLRPDAEVRTGPARSLTTWDYRPSRALSADGAFRYDDLADGAYVLDAWSSDDRDLRGTAKARAGDADVVVVLARPTPSGDALHVRVLDADGGPVPQATLSYVHVYDAPMMDGTNKTHRQGSEPRDPVAVRDGAATITLPREEVGDRWLAVRQARARSGVATPGAVVVLVPDPLPAEMEIRLPPERRIGGRVVDPDGAGVPGVRVRLNAAASGSFEWWIPYGATEQAAATTRADGSFDVGGLGDLTYRLSFETPTGYAPLTAIKIAAGTSGVEVRLLRGVEPTIRVLDALGRPLEGCSVSVTQSSGLTTSMALSTRTEADGVVKLPPLDPNVRYELSVGPPEGRDDLLHAWTQSWSPVDAVIRLDPAFAVAGLVRDAAGKPLAGALVSYRRANTVTGKTLSGEDGRFRVTGLRAKERIRLRAAARGDEEHDDRVEGDATEATAGDEDVALVANAGATLRVHVADLPPGVSVPYRVSSTGGSQRGAVGRYRDDRVPADGVLRLAGLDPAAKYRVFVGPTDDGKYALSDELSTGGDDAVLHLVQGEPLAGRVNLPSGVAAKEVVLYASGEGWMTRTRVDAQGGFRFPGLPPHATRLDSFVYRQGKTVFRATATSPVGTDVVLNLQPAPLGR
jgi:RNA polymerase sigma-70 factor (ECF subfamily)